MKKKQVILLTIILLLCVIIISMIVNQNKNIKKEAIIIKEMSESTQITDLNNQINALNVEHSEYMNYIETCKTQIATALTNEGVEISDTATLEIMANDIGKVLQARTKNATATAEDIANGKTAYVNGNLVTGNYTSDFSSKDDIDTYGFGHNSNTGQTTWYAVPRTLKNMSSSGNYFVITVPGTYWITADALNAPYLFINNVQTDWNIHYGVGAGGYYYLPEGTTVMAHSHGYGYSCSMALLKISDNNIT